MNIVVPLAGPDFERPDGSVKAEHPLGGRPLLRAALEGRAWWPARGGDLVFVLRDLPASRAFAQRSLLAWYPQAKTVWLSAFAGGAALSAAAGVSLIDDGGRPLMVDLCDILFECDVDPSARFAEDRALGGLAVTFPSDLEQYSYLELDADGTMIRAREKSVISTHASAGVYAFRNSAIFWNALAHSLENKAELAYRGNLFVCPLFNGVVAGGRQVRTAPAAAVVDIKIA